jgi:hypothetical protein
MKGGIEAQAEAHDFVGLLLLIAELRAANAASLYTLN